MALTKNNTKVTNIQELADIVVDQATTVKALFDKSNTDIKTYINDTLTVELDALDAANVKKIGDQTIAGVKTFSSSPIVPAPTTDLQASTKKYVDDREIAQTNVLTTHKTSTDHDGRYYTETEVNTTFATKAEVQTVALGQILDGTITEAKLSFDPVTQIELDASKADYVAQWVNVNEYNTITDAIAEVMARKASGQTPILWFSPRNTAYESISTITIPAGIHLKMDMPLVYTGTAEEPALIIGAQGVNNLKVDLTIRVTRQTQSSWLSENNIGVVIYNANTAKIFIAEVSNFTIGFQAIGSSGGFSYNNIELGYLMSNKIAVDLTNETSTAGVGWCNENKYIGGRFGVTTGGTTVGKSRYGVRISSKDGTYLINNNNIFDKPSFELGLSEALPGEAVPILIENGSYNKFIGCRDESNSLTFARVTNASESNQFDLGYTGLVTTIECLNDQSVKRNSIISLPCNKIFEEGHVIFNSGNLVQKACYYDGSTNVNIAGVAVTSSTDTTPKKTIPTSATIINANDLELTVGRGVGVVIKTKSSKRFVIKKDTEVGFGGRTVIRCYNSAGVVMTTNTPVKGNITFSYSTSYGGCFMTGADSDMIVFINLDTLVEEIHLFIIDGTNNLKIRGFEVISLDGYCPVSVGYEEITPGVNLGTSIPTLGTWAVGRKIINPVPTVGQPKGWICTVAGTPGTWVSEGIL